MTMAVRLYTVMIALVSVSKLCKFENIHYQDGGTYSYYSDGTGNYNYKYQIPDQQRHEEASVDITSIGEGTLVVRGEYSFNVGGQIYKVSYVADSNGYRARVQQEKESSGLSTTVPPFSGIPTTVPGVSTAVPLPKISKNAIESIGGGRSGK